MPAGKLFYALVAASSFSTFVLTILNGLTFAALQSLLSTSSTDIAPLGLSLISCVALIVTSVLLHKNVRNGSPWPYWKTGVFCFMGVFLIVAAGTTARTMKSPQNPDQTMLCTARSIFWAISVFTQGLYCGFLLLASSQTRSDAAWPQEMKHLPDCTSTLTTPPQAARDPYSEMGHFDTRRSSLRKYPRRSNRYSGGTLCLQTSPSDKCASFDTMSTISSPEPSPTHENMPGVFLEHETRSSRSNHSIRSMPSLRAPRVQQSLDTLVQPSPSESVETLTPTREHHIHPLFRSTSPSPSPMPTGRTRVQASPSAGQTITKNTLTRMRSARSLRERSMCSTSPLPGPEDDGPSGLRLSFGHVRRSITQYEQRYEIHESPDEK